MTTPSESYRNLEQRILTDKAMSDTERETVCEQIMDLWGQLSPEEQLAANTRIAGKLSDTAVATIAQNLSGLDSHAAIQTLHPSPMADEGGKPRGLPRLNPQFEAALLERLQFDDDVPELRTGYLPVGSKPAVPVQVPAGCLNLALVGAMLEQASTDTLHEINQLVDQQRAPIHALLIAQEEQHSTALMLSPEQVTELVEQTSRQYAPEPVGYKRGQFPALRSITVPEGTLLQAPVSQLQTWAYRAVATTQGRRSLVPVLAEQVRTELARMLVGKNRGQLLISLTKLDDPVAEAEYTVLLTNATDTSHEFPLIQTAARVLAESLFEDLSDSLTVAHANHMRLFVSTVDRYDLRRVGWSVSVAQQ